VISHQVISLIRGHAAGNPFGQALVSGAERLDYQTLERQSNQLARLLQLRGVLPGSLVAIVLERSPQFVVSALAVWKAGAAYVPVDPAYPVERIASMLDDSGAPIVVTNRVSQPAIAGLEQRLLLIDRENTAIAAQASDALAATIAGDSLAYVIYTSGSTGQPNGVEVTHANVAHLCGWHQRAFNVTGSDRATFAASPGFDAAVWEIWPYLAAGATLHLPDDITRRSPELLRNWLVANRITIAFAPTPLAEAMLTLDWPANTHLRTLLTGADTLHRFPPAGLPFNLVNNYGPTECTVVSTSGTVPPAAISTGRPSIGQPLPYADIRILDAHRSPVHAGIEGEIYIGGAGVARGYRNRPELSASRFIGGFFKTGDRGRLLPNGEIEFLGRKDEQIKIRGFRVEPGEITSALNRHRAVRASAVVLGKAGCDARLVAYLVLRAESSALSPTVLQDFLQPQLPEHMIPATFVVVDELPATSHGKVDRARLPEPSPENTLRNADPVGHSAIEKQVVDVLSTLLQTAGVGLDDNFFMLGGHSLMGTQLIVRLRDLFGVDLNLLTLFDNPTPRSLSAGIEELLGAQLDAMSEVELGELVNKAGA
jgi:amino acid adenylation domain-containing protein